MVSEFMVALVLSVSTALGVGGAAWLLMFRPLMQPIKSGVPDERSVPPPAARIDWSIKGP